MKIFPDIINPHSDEEVFVYLNASELDELIALLTEKRALMQ